MNSNVEKDSWDKYYSSVYSDYLDLTSYYPFSFLSIYPTVRPTCVSIVVIAADNNLINAVNATAADFLGTYSRKILVDIPFDYKNSGCKIYGAKWLNFNRIPDNQLHIYHDKVREPFGYEFCVGTPDSFKFLSNVILENVKTADRMLVAYEEFLKGRTTAVNLLAYSHGEAGRQEYINQRIQNLSRGIKYGKTK